MTSRDSVDWPTYERSRQEFNSNFFSLWYKKKKKTSVSHAGQMIKPFSGKTNINLQGDNVKM